VPSYQSAAALQRVRKAALREVRRRERAADTAIEKIERRLYTLLDRKTLITHEVALTIVPYWNDFLSRVNDLEAGITDFITTTNT